MMWIRKQVKALIVITLTCWAWKNTTSEGWPECKSGKLHGYQRKSQTVRDQKTCWIYFLLKLILVLNDHRLICQLHHQDGTIHDIKLITFFSYYKTAHELMRYIFVSAFGGVVCILLLTSLCLFRKYFTKQQGEYHTNEAKDADRYDNPDAAVAMGDTGQPEIPRKKEYFIWPGSNLISWCDHLEITRENMNGTYSTTLL